MQIGMLAILERHEVRHGAHIAFQQKAVGLFAGVEILPRQRQLRLKTLPHGGGVGFLLLD